MRPQLLLAFAMIAFVSQAHCACDKPIDGKESDDGDVTKFFKNLGCDIKKGADKISETAKPWVKEIGDSAKRFGGTVSDTFTDLKNKISGSSSNNSVSEGSPTPAATTAEGASSSPTPVKVSIEDRILLETPPRCREGERLDAQNNCRKS